VDIEPLEKRFAEMEAASIGKKPFKAESAEKMLVEAVSAREMLVEVMSVNEKAAAAGSTEMQESPYESSRAAAQTSQTQ
jgi:hypothetical protein